MNAAPQQDRYSHQMDLLFAGQTNQCVAQSAVQIINFVAMRRRRALNVGHLKQDFSSEIVEGGKNAAGDELSLDRGEPDFDLVKPRRIGWRKMDPHIAMTIDKLPDPGGAMGRKIICNNVDLLALGKAGHDLFRGKPPTPHWCDEARFGPAPGRFWC